MSTSHSTITNSQSTSHSLINNPLISLSLIELNALRYFAGYICKKIINLINKTKINNKRDMLLFMTDICSIGNSHDDETEESQLWINIRNRGGLYHINADAFQLFVEIETELQKVMNLRNISKLPNQAATVEQIKTTESVVSSWKTLTQNYAELNFEAIDTLLLNIVEEFISVRGKYFADSLIEAYKKMNRKVLQKSKGLRKTIH